MYRSSLVNASRSCLRLGSKIAQKDASTFKFVRASQEVVGHQITSVCDASTFAAGSVRADVFSTKRFVFL